MRSEQAFRAIARDCVERFLEHLRSCAIIGMPRRCTYSAGKVVGAEEARTVPLLKRAAKAARDLRDRKPFWH